MDYARKIGTMNKPKKWQRRSTIHATVGDNFLSQEPSILGDHRLDNWKKWLTNRKKQYEYIKSKTGRQPGQQLLNSSEKVRPLIEMRNLMDHANIPVPIIPDKHRGGPEFWRTPQMLSNRGDPCLPDVEITPDKKALNLTPELLYADLPAEVEKEKGLSGLKSKEPLWKRSEYLRKRKTELATEIQLLVPKEPEMEELMIRGHDHREKCKEQRIPPITISTVEDHVEPEENSDQVIILKIQDQEIIWQKSNFETSRMNTDPLTWSLTFSSRLNERAEKKIVFENKGNRVIVCEWRDASFQDESMCFEKRISPFFFNKTKSLLPPGQIVELQVWYLPRVYGVFSESWRLVTDPKLCPSPLMFRFWGCAESTEPQGIKLQSQAIDDYLNRCIRDSVIREIINDIVENVDSNKPPEPAYASLFLEADIFKARNPLCFYHPSLVTELRKIYYHVTNQSTVPWSLSLNDLREILLEIKEPGRRNDTLLQFSRLYKDCLKPTLYKGIENDKYKIVYNILCSFVNQFEEESEYTKSSLLKEYKESVGTIVETDPSKLISITELPMKSNSSRGKRERKSSIGAQDNEIKQVQTFPSDLNYQLYREVFFIRVHEFLGEAIRRISATVDSFNRLNERVK